MDTNVVRPIGPSSCTVTFDWWVEPALSTASELLHEVGTTPDSHQLRAGWQADAGGVWGVLIMHDCLLVEGKLLCVSLH